EKEDFGRLNLGEVSLALVDQCGDKLIKRCARTAGSDSVDDNDGPGRLCIAPAGVRLSRRSLHERVSHPPTVNFITCGNFSTLPAASSAWAFTSRVLPFAFRTTSHSAKLSRSA